MVTRLDDPLVRQTIADARTAARAGRVHPSPADWRDAWIYFVLLDRFNNPAASPAGTWDRFYSQRQGGTFTGVTAQLDYLATLGCGAIWLSPVVKNPRPDDWEYNYHGYATQDFLNIDERFASDGTRRNRRSGVDGARRPRLTLVASTSSSTSSSTTRAACSTT